NFWRSHAGPGESVPSCPMRRGGGDRPVAGKRLSPVILSRFGVSNRSDTTGLRDSFAKTTPQLPGHFGPPCRSSGGRETKMELPQGIDSKFRYILVSAKRAHQLVGGAQARVQSESKKVIVIAQREVCAGLVPFITYDGHG